MINAISGITYDPANMLQSNNNFLHFFNQAIEMGYDPTEARKWAQKKVKEKKEEKTKNRKVENSDKSKQTKHIDRRA